MNIIKKYIFLSPIVLFSICQFAEAEALHNHEAKRGVMIAGVGISGAGKSSTFKALHKLTGGHLFVEPEESELPDFLKQLEHCDQFTILMAFRCLRMPNFIKAEKLRKKGELVLLDSYFDKIMYSYIGKKEFNWLMSAEHPYFPAVKAIKELDKDTIPDADVIVLFEIDYKTWRRFLKMRNRTTDNDECFLKSYGIAKAIEEAVEDIARRKHIKVIKFRQEFSSPEEQAKKLRDILINNNVIKMQPQRRFQ